MPSCALELLRMRLNEPHGVHEGFHPVLPGCPNRPAGTSASITNLADTAERFADIKGRHFIPTIRQLDDRSEANQDLGQV